MSCEKTVKCPFAPCMVQLLRVKVAYKIGEQVEKDGQPDISTGLCYWTSSPGCRSLLPGPRIFP